MNLKPFFAHQIEKGNYVCYLNYKGCGYSICGGAESKIKYGESFTKGDVITVDLDMKNDGGGLNSKSSERIFFMKNGKKFPEISLKKIIGSDDVKIDFYLAIWMNYVND